MSQTADLNARARRPRTESILQSYHADCEGNFLRLQKLLGDFDEAATATVVLPDGGRDDDQVELTVCERSPYTALVDVSQRRASWDGGQRMFMQVRVYLDARMAEVVSCQGMRHFRIRYEYPNPHMFARDEKWQLNHFLGEWLSACLRHGLADVDWSSTARESQRGR